MDLTRPPAASELSADPGAALPGVLVKELFTEHYSQMVRLAQYLSGQPDRGEEIAQEAFAVLLRRAETLEDPSAAGAYLRQVVTNLAASAARRRRLAWRHRGTESHSRSRPGDEAGAVDDRTVVLAALARLSRRQRECLVLRYYLDLAEVDIAASLGITTGSVKTHSSRGIAALAQILGEAE
jgi:RNA polymerase sigma-70 factor (sigma-E family)